MGGRRRVNLIEEKHMNGKSWRNGPLAVIFRSFFSDAFDLLEGFLDNFIKEQQRKILKQLSKAVVLFTGSLFLLNALALFISEYLEKSTWFGYSIVGGVLILLALIFWKE